MDVKIKAYIEKHPRWSNELHNLRSLLSQMEMEETVKWGMPVYTVNNKNVVGLAGFKNHFGLWFYQGVFLKDKRNILINAQEGKTKAMRHLRFTSAEEVDNKIVLEYVREAIKNAYEGKEIKAEKVVFEMPEILKAELENDIKLSEAFSKFSSAKQNEFFEFIGSAKRKVTQLNRLDKSLALIFKGQTPMDKYRKK